MAASAIPFSYPAEYGFEGTALAKADKCLDDMAATLAGGKTRPSRDKVHGEIENITHQPWVGRVSG
jgi:hypothetical protein